MKKNRYILAVDIGTSTFKMGLFEQREAGLHLVQQYFTSYQINTYNDGLFSDINPENWKDAFINGCQQLKNFLAKVGVIVLSGTTPGLTAMDKEGEALYPAILMLDQRSRKQAQYIINEMGLDYLLQHTGNMPVAGGCSLASILWLKDNYPQVFDNTYKFGHSNTYLAKWITGNFAIDPSSASLTALYNTVKNDLSWNREIAETFNLQIDQLPELIHAYDCVGRIRFELAQKMGFTKETQVLIGGNDAVLAAYSAGINKSGDIININGTCEITLVCLPISLYSKNYNIRAHVLPQKWLTLYVMNAGGKALEWFKSLFCSEMSDSNFYNEFITSAIENWITKKITVSYAPFLMGSRYSLKPLQAELKNLTMETSREEIFIAIIRSLAEYQKLHLEEIGQSIQLNKQILVTGGAVNEALIKAKQKWLRDCRYILVEQSSLKGAALLGKYFLENKQNNL
jgi:xylulokinase